MLKFKLALTAGLAVGCTSVATVNAGPPLDRPTPPPYCADGVCRPNTVTHGWYQTRWRRWPTEVLEPTPADKRPTGEQVPELPSVDRPRKEDEDRAAPPPTKAAERAREEEEQDTGMTTPGVETPGGVPFVPPGGGFQSPRPAGDGVPAPTLEMPYNRQEPATTPSPGTSPTGDLDPPPAPPFGGPSLVNQAAGARPALVAPATRVRPRSVNRSSSDDPPPAYPLAQLQR